MKMNLTKTNFTSGVGIVSHFFRSAVWLIALFLICSSAFAQNLFVSGTDARGGEIYKFSWDGQQSIFASGLADPRDLAFDSMGNLLMSDLGGKIYRYDLSGVLHRYRRTTFGSVPSSAQSLACDSAGNLLVVDAGGVNSTGTVTPNAIYKFTPLGARSTFASGQALSESFACLAVQPMSPLCCE